MDSNFWKVWMINNVMQYGRYFLFAGVAWLIFYVLFKNKWRNKKIQQHYPAKKQVRREIRDSIVSLCIFSMVFVILYVAAQNGYSRVYKKMDAIGWWYFWLGFPLFIVWHDTWFYWTHRLMHLPRLFKLMHRQHHLSHNPTPWTAFAFHPLEAILEAGFVFIILLVPFHPINIAFGITWQMLFNVYGHMGYELMPAKLQRSLAGRLFNTSTHHNMHHRLTRGNYGLYFSFWDRLMRTNHPDYEKQMNKSDHSK
jgi:Delta7-sterol 5-desaturase